MGDAPSFADRLRSSLDSIADQYRRLISGSTIRNVDPNRGGRHTGVVAIGFPSWGWSPDPELVAVRTTLRHDLDEWLALFVLLHRTPLPETARRIESAGGLLRRWLHRDGGDHSIPATIEGAQVSVDSAFAELQALIDVAEGGSSELSPSPTPTSC